jgi:hypothetical protein
MSGEVDAMLPNVFGGLSVALARTFPILDPDVKHPSTKLWERAVRIFDLQLRVGIGLTPSGIRDTRFRLVRQRRHAVPDNV